MHKSETWAKSTLSFRSEISRKAIDHSVSTSRKHCKSHGKQQRRITRGLITFTVSEVDTAQAVVLYNYTTDAVDQLKSHKQHHTTITYHFPVKPQECCFTNSLASDEQRPVSFAAVRTTAQFQFYNVT